MSTLYTINNKLVMINNKFIQKYEEPDPFMPVQIGNQIWSGKNLDVDDGGAGIYKKDQEFEGVGVVTQYFYTISAVNRILTSITGWRLPTKSEWESLFSYVGQPKKLKSVDGWATTGSYASEKGTDDYGFCALPINSYYYDNNFSKATWWTDDRSGNWQYLSQIDKDSFITNSSQYPTANAPVRLIKDS